MSTCLPTSIRAVHLCTAPQPHARNVRLSVDSANARHAPRQPSRGTQRPSQHSRTASRFWSAHRPLFLSLTRRSASVSADQRNSRDVGPLRLPVGSLITTSRRSAASDHAVRPWDGPCCVEACVDANGRAAGGGFIERSASTGALRCLTDLPPVREEQLRCACHSGQRRLTASHISRPKGGHRRRPHAAMKRSASRSAIALASVRPTTRHRRSACHSASAAIVSRDTLSRRGGSPPGPRRATVASTTVDHPRAAGSAAGAHGHATSGPFRPRSSHVRC